MNMMKEVGKIFTVGFVIILIVALAIYYYSEQERERAHETESPCGGKYYSYDSEYSCCVDCESIGMEMLRYNYQYGGVFKQEVEKCTCKSKDGAIKIW